MDDVMDQLSDTYPWGSLQGGSEEQLPYFLAAVAQVDAELQHFYRIHQSGAMSDFFPPEYESEFSSSRTPFWAEQTPHWQHSIPEFSLVEHSRLAQLVEYYQLTNFELAVVIIGCLNAFEPRYQQLFSALPFQRNGMPTAELVLTLFCQGMHVRHAQRQCFSLTSPLVYNGLIELKPDKMTRYSVLETPDWVRLWLFDEWQLPQHLQHFTRWLDPQPDHDSSDLAAFIHHPASQPPLLEARYELGAEEEAGLANLAQYLGARALWVSWSHLLSDEREAVRTLRQLLDIARLWRVLLVFHLTEPVEREEADIRQGNLRASLDQIVTQAGMNGFPLPICCLMAADIKLFPFPALNRWTLDFTVPDVDTRHAQFLSTLSESPEWDTRQLIRQMTLTQQEMRNAVCEARSLSQRQGRTIPREADYREAFLRRSRKNFGRLAYRMTPQRCWDDIIIPDELQEELHDILGAIRSREKVLNQGFAHKLGQATGISALFHGNPGTGKTLVAEVLAAELGVDLIRVDLSTVVNKYIGETEKNLGRIFDLAAQDAGVLFFDEADALFGKRGESKDAKDRHANIEVAYLLQRLEQHPGLVILATNHRGHLDEAFTRRFTFITRFLWPDAALREKMWRNAWPPTQPLAPDIDFSRLAQVQLTGANICNIALQASWLAAGAPFVSVADIKKALRREMGKMGRNVLTKAGQ